MIPTAQATLSLRPGPDGTLLLDPLWVLTQSPIPFEKMERPPRVKLDFIEGQLTGQLALQGGAWSPLFSMPMGAILETEPDEAQESSSEMTSGSSSSASFDFAEVRLDSKEEMPKAKVESSTDEERSPIAEAVLSGNRIVIHVDAENGKDSNNGKSRLGKVHSSEGPKRTMLAAAQIASSEMAMARAADPTVTEVEFVVQAGSYEWNPPADPAIRHIVITPVGDVVFNSASTQPNSGKTPPPGIHDPGL